MNSVIQPFLLSLIAGLATGLGCIIVRARCELILLEGYELHVWQCTVNGFVTEDFFCFLILKTIQ